MIRGTVIQETERFCTLVEKELRFWKIVDGIPQEVKHEDLDTEDWRLDLPELKLEITQERLIDEVTNTSVYKVGMKGGRLFGRITCTDIMANWLKRNFGD